jgi:hypothetical protein
MSIKIHDSNSWFVVLFLVSNIIGLFSIIASAWSLNLLYLIFPIFLISSKVGFCSRRSSTLLIPISSRRSANL